MSVLIATWNVWWRFGEWEARQPAIEHTLLALDADVIALQETWPGQAEALAGSFGYAHRWSGRESDRTDDPMGNALLSRWPIIDSGFRFLADDEGREYRSVLHAAVDSPHGVIPMFVTHLEYRFDRSATRVAQLQTVCEFVAETVAAADADFPPVLCGDLNAVPDSDEIRKLTGRTSPYVDGRIWSDAWELVGVGPGITWSLENGYINDTTWPNRRIDYVMIGWPRDDRPRGNPVAAEVFGNRQVDGVTPSDHFGVAVEIAS